MQSFLLFFNKNNIKSKTSPYIFCHFKENAYLCNIPSFDMQEETKPILLQI